MITNAEWQAAVAGTVDPGESTTYEGVCRTGPDLSGPRPTGRAGDAPGGVGSCISLWGAEDMIGNLWEWTADWWQAGRGWMASDEDWTHNWPAAYSSDGEDGTYNLDGRVFSSGWSNGLPAAGFRGGDWGNGTQAGAFAINLGGAPSHRSSDIGFRCARSF